LGRGLSNKALKDLYLQALEKLKTKYAPNYAPMLMIHRQILILNRLMIPDKHCPANLSCSILQALEGTPVHPFEFITFVVKYAHLSV
jgi:hypothetical protein